MEPYGDVTFYCEKCDWEEVYHFESDEVFIPNCPHCVDGKVMMKKIKSFEKEKSSLRDWVNSQY